MRFEQGELHPKFKHGASRTPEYIAWTNMWNRCTKESNPAFKYYGGRGVSVCERWRDFQAFAADMGARPSKRHSIDRIDVDGNYEPANCRWATREEQQHNRRDNVLTELDVSVIKRRRINGESHGKIGADYGLNKNRISQICNGRAWKSVPPCITARVLD